MALPTVHAVAGFLRRGAFRPVWSEAQGTGVVSTNTAPKENDPENEGRPVLRVTSTVDVYVVVGDAPVAGGVRTVVRAGTTVDIEFRTGDKFLWLAA